MHHFSKVWKSWQIKSWKCASNHNVAKNGLVQGILIEWFANVMLPLLRQYRRIICGQFFNMDGYRQIRMKSIIHVHTLVNQKHLSSFYRVESWGNDPPMHLKWWTCPHFTNHLSDELLSSFHKIHMLFVINLTWQKEIQGHNDYDATTSYKKG